MSKELWKGLTELTEALDSYRSTKGLLPSEHEMLSEVDHDLRLAELRLKIDADGSRFDPLPHEHARLIDQISNATTVVKSPQAGFQEVASVTDTLRHELSLVLANVEPDHPWPHK